MTKDSNRWTGKLVLATRNKDKVREIKALLADTDIEIVNLDMFPNVPEVVEDGETLEENAIKKAREVADFTGLPAVSDDTGLEVDYLGGKPGVYSSRFSGENATYADNVAKLLQELQGVPEARRTARFRCVAALVDTTREETVDGVCEGSILEQPRGERGFGYDPIFYVPEFKATFSEMNSKLKNQISHRAQAFLKIKGLLTQK